MRWSQKPESFATQIQKGIMMLSSKSDCISGTKTFYFTFLASLFLHTLASPTLHYCRHDQRDALIEFKNEFPVNKSNPNPYDVYL